jgi:hypothetical protein
VIATSQIALPEDICTEVYATDGYEQSVQNMSAASLAGDMVFGEDGGARQLGTVTGSVAVGLQRGTGRHGLTTELAVPLAG